MLLAYNVFVICVKCLLQLVGCVFLSTLQYNFCWLIQLFGIACLNKFKSQSSLELNRGTFSQWLRFDCITCKLEISINSDIRGVWWRKLRRPSRWSWHGLGRDYLCLLDLAEAHILQLLLFPYQSGNGSTSEACFEVILKPLWYRNFSGSYWNFNFNNRGAELIEELMQNQIRQQEEQEKQVLEKIKMKMDRIKATHDKQNNKDNHFDGTHSLWNTSLQNVLF